MRLILNFVRCIYDIQFTKKQESKEKKKELKYRNIEKYKIQKNKEKN